MTTKTVIKDIMKLRGYTLQVLADKIGYKSNSGVAERLKGDNSMNVETLLKFLKNLDCELEVKSKLTDGKSWKITDSNYEEIMSRLSAPSSTSTEKSSPAPAETEPEKRSGIRIPLPDLSGYTEEEILEIVREHNEEENKRAMGIPVDTPKPEPRKSVKIPLTPSAIQKAKDEYKSFLFNTEEES